MDTTEITESTVGEVEPTEQMWRKVIVQLRRACAGRIADPERADIVVGDLLVRIQQNLHSIEDRQRLLHWVVRIAAVPRPTRTRRLCSVSSRHACGRCWAASRPSSAAPSR